MSGPTTIGDGLRTPGGLAPHPAAAPIASMVLAQATAEVRSTLRNGEQLLLTLVIPLVLLVGLARASIVSLGSGPAIDIVAPGILALAIMSTAFTSQAIATGFERRYGVLKLLGATPLSRVGLVAAKSAAVVLVEALQLVLIVVAGYLLGWAPHGSWPAAAVLLVLGTLAFSTLGLLLAGVLRAEATLAAANAVYLLLLLGGGVVVPLAKLPDAVAGVARLLPSGALGEGLRTVLHGGGGLGEVLGQVVVLLVWALAAGGLAAKTFRWE